VARHRAPRPHTGYTAGMVLLIVGTLGTVLAPVLPAGLLAL